MSINALKQNVIAFVDSSRMWLWCVLVAYFASVSSRICASGDNCRFGVAACSEAAFSAGCTYAFMATRSFPSQASALSACESKFGTGSSLAAPGDAAVNAMLFSMCDSHRFMDLRRRDGANCNEWESLDRTQRATYLNFDAGEPTSGTCPHANFEGCAGFKFQLGNSRWHDSPCTPTAPLSSFVAQCVVCVLPPTPQPTPPPTSQPTPQPTPEPVTPAATVATPLPAPTPTPKPTPVATTTAPVTTPSSTFQTTQEPVSTTNGVATSSRGATAPSTTIIASTSAITAASSTSTNATPTTAVNPTNDSSTTAVVPAPTTTSIEPWSISVIVGGVMFALILVGLGVYCLLKIQRQQPNAANNALELKPRPRSDYGELPFKSSSTFAANAAEFKSGISQESHYGVIHDADHYAKSAVEFKVDVSQEPNYSKISDDELK
jgi:hypothetical protein